MLSQVSHARSCGLLAKISGWLGIWSRKGNRFLEKRKGKLYQSIIYEVLEVEEGIDCEGMTNLEIAGPVKDFAEGDGAHFDFLIWIKVDFLGALDVFSKCEVAEVAKNGGIWRAVGEKP